MTPKKNSARNRCRIPIRWGTALLGIAIAWPTTAQDDDAIVVAPVMVFGDADAPQWDTIPELKAAAESGDADACFQYAQRLEAGDEVDQDHTKAFQFYQNAARQDHRDALFRVGKAYHDGQLGQAENQPLAFEFYQRAAYLDHPVATHNVGAMLVSARGVKRDYVEGLAWLMLAAEMGTDPGAVDQVKDRLKRRPEWITRAENRLDGLKAEIAAGPIDEDTSLAPSVAKPKAPVVTPAPAIRPPSLPSLRPSIAPPSVAPPQIPISAPQPALLPPPASED
jgi:uncharacterized protein